MMQNVLKGFGVPPAQLGNYPDILLALGVVGILGILIVPLPAFMLDSLVALNITAAAVILLTSLFARDALVFSSFPSVLLLTTLFRLALNVSTTRMILARGKAGDVVRFFGEFVLQGDLIVGMVIFLVITLVQFLVIAKGAERVAEVSARFTLDAMPGKQMSIDAAVRSGAIDEEDAQSKREELERESKLFGAMDGAMKFVKGDTIAALLITALNLIAGMLIGVVRLDMNMQQAAEIYSTLTVGDGLVSQIPALLITLSAGIVTTRVQPQDKHSNLGHSIKLELLANPKALGVAGLLCLALGIVPGMPLVPFWALAAAMAGLMLGLLHKHHLLRRESETKAAVFRKKLERQVAEAKAQRSAADSMAPTVVAIGVDLDPQLSAALGFGPDEDDSSTELLESVIPQLRDALYSETGIRFPGVHVRSYVKTLPKNTFTLRIKDVAVVQEQLAANKMVAMATPERLRRIGIRSTETITHPIHGGMVGLIEPQERSVAEACGIQVWTIASFIALRLAAVLREHATAFIGIQEVSELVERLRKGFPALVDEVIPKVVSLHQLVDVLRRLIDEGVSIRDLKSIVEALGEHAVYEHDGVALTERVRSALSLQIANAYAGLSGELPALLLDPVIEETVRDGVHHSDAGSYLALDPEISRTITQSIARALEPMVREGVRPIVLTTSSVRRYVRKLIEPVLPTVAVLAFEELPGQLSVQPIGRATLGDVTENERQVSTPVFT